MKILGLKQNQNFKGAIELNGPNVQVDEISEAVIKHSEQGGHILPPFKTGLLVIPASGDEGEVRKLVLATKNESRDLFRFIINMGLKLGRDSIYTASLSNTDVYVPRLADIQNVGQFYHANVNKYFPNLKSYSAKEILDAIKNNRFDFKSLSIRKSRVLF